MQLVEKTWNKNVIGVQTRSDRVAVCLYINALLGRLVLYYFSIWTKQMQRITHVEYRSKRQQHDASKHFETARLALNNRTNSEDQNTEQTTTNTKTSAIQQMWHEQQKQKTQNRKIYTFEIRVNKSLVLLQLINLYRFEIAARV